MTPNEYKSASDIAEMVGRNPSVIQRLARQHGIEKTKDGYSVAAMLEAMATAAKNDARAKLSEDDPRRRKLELENRILEIKIAESERRLVDAEQVEQEAQRVGSAIRNDILSLPQSLAPRLAGKTDLAEISKTLDDALRDCLRHLADTVCNTPAE